MHAEFGCGPTVSLICQTWLVLPLLIFENPNPDTRPGEHLDSPARHCPWRAESLPCLEFWLVDFSGHDVRTALY